MNQQKKPPAPEDFDTWQGWQEAKAKYDQGRVFGPPPIKARPILVFVVLISVVVPLATVLMGRAGWGMQPETRTGTAQIHGCSFGLVSHRCTGDVTFADGAAFSQVRIRSSEAVTGEVAVAEHEVWDPDQHRHSRYEAEVWVSDHRPTPHPNLWPVGWVLAAALVILVGAILFKPIGNWLVGRSQHQWRAARIAAGRAA